MLAIKRALFAFLMIMITVSALHATQDAAIVILLEGDAWVQRNGFKHALKIKTPLFKSDKIVTEANAKVQLLFVDDTALTIGPSSELIIDDFLFGGNDKPKFAVSLAKGASRVISGKVVEQNPDGFTIGTPRTTVGIRGTDVVWNTSVSTDSILVNQIAKGHTVAFQNLKSGATTVVRQQGTLVTANANGFIVERVPVTGNSQLIMDMLGITTGTTVNKGNSDSTVSAGKGSFGGISSGFEVAEKDHIATEKDDYITNIVPKPLDDSISGYYRGSITSGGSGVFGFKADLKNGNLSDAYISAKSGSTSFSAAGGGGALVNSGNAYQFNLGGFTVAGRPYPNVNGTRVTFDGVIDSITVKINWAYYENNTEMILKGLGEGSKYWTLGAEHQEIYATYKGTLGSSDGRSDGVFGFRANLTVGTLSGVYMFANSRYGYVHATGGAGAIYRPFNTAEGTYQFLATNFNTATDGAYSEINHGSIFGNISGDVLNGTWEVNNSSGNYISGSVAGEKGDFGQVPDAPKNDIVAAFKGTLAGDGISTGSFGFNANLSKSTISSAYVAGTATDGSFLGVNGTGTLARSGFLVSSFNASGFTMSGSGTFAGVDSVLFESGVIRYDRDTATLNAILKSGDTTLGLYTGTGSYSESLGSIPTYDPLARYVGDTYNAGNTNKAGDFGFGLNLANGGIYDFYMTVQDADNVYIASGGKGELAADNLFDISSLPIYNAPFGSKFADIEGQLTNGKSSVTINWDINDEDDNLLHSGTGSGSLQSNGSSVINAHYAGLSSNAGVTSAMGFSLNTAVGTVSNAYFFEDSIYGTISATGGSGVVAVDSSNNSVVVAGGFNVTGTGMNTLADTGDLYALYDSSSFRGNWSAGYMENGAYNNAKGHVEGTVGVQQGVAPDMPMGDKVAHYRGNLDANSHFTSGTTGFDINFNAAEDHVSNAFIHGVVDTNSQFLATGGFGSLDMKIGHAAYAIDNFVVNGSGSFTEYDQAELKGEINRNSNTNPLNWGISGDGVISKSGTANVVITQNPSAIPSLPTFP